MKYPIIAATLAVAIGLPALYFGTRDKHAHLEHGDCIQLEIPKFYEKTCEPAVGMVRKTWIGRSENYVVQMPPSIVAKGCPEFWRADANDLRKVLRSYRACPKE